MSDDLSPRLSLPLLDAGQAQKELTHNEALTLLDMLAQSVVQAVGLDVPPVAPLPGQCWIVGPDPIGAWAGQAQALAGWSESGWRLCPPVSGMRVWNLADGCEARYENGAWSQGVARAARIEIGGVQVVAGRQPAVSPAQGGATVDSEARTAIAAIIAALQTHGLIAS